MPTRRCLPLTTAVRGLAFTPREEHLVPRQELARIDICWSAVAGLSNIDIIRGSDFQTRSLLLAMRAGEPFRIARALAVEACLVSAVGGSSLRRGAKLLQAADALARRVSQPYAPAIVALAKAVTAFLGGDWKAASAFCAQADEAFRSNCTGVWWERDTAQTYLLWSYQYSGRLAAADLQHHAHAALRRRGELVGGEQGRSLVDRADAWMAAQAIQDPGRMCAVLAPGFR